MESRKDILWRVYLVYFGILVFGLAIIGKIAYIQIYEGESLKAKAQTQELRAFNLEANRGNILAEDGSLLATSVPIFEIRMDVASNHISETLFKENLDSLALGIALIFDGSKRQIKTKLQRARKSGNRYFLIHRKATYSQLKALRKLPILRRGKYRGGLIAIQKTKRVMPFMELAARTIGYENRTENLFVGLEGAYSEVLTGTDGKQVMRRINHGDWIPIHDENEMDPRDGLDIVSTIDIHTQDVAESALLRELMNNKAFQGCAVLMEVETGHIKAIANLRYDSTDGKYKETYNYAIGESIEPGSTFKLASILTALEDEKFELTDSLVTGEGYTTFWGRPLRDVHKIGNGRVTVRDAFEHSSNVGISKLINNAYKEKPSEFIEGLYDLSLNNRLGVEIKGEGRPYIKHPSKRKSWYGTSLPWMSIGYELQITPLQTLSLYNAVANEGRMVKPMFITEIREGGISIETFETTVINKQIVSDQTIDSARSLLEGVVERGTARRVFKGCPYKVAGKTGTAQIAVGGQYNKTNYNATFVGYFPAENPKYSCIVVINNPSGGKYYGGSVAAPVFKEIADKIYSTSLVLGEETVPTEAVDPPVLKHPAVYDDIKDVYVGLNQVVKDQSTGEEWVRIKKTQHGLAMEAKVYDGLKVPNVKGMKARDAVYLLENMGLRASISGRGYVRTQSLKAGSNIHKGQKINLQLSMY